MAQGSSVAVRSIGRLSRSARAVIAAALAAMVVLLASACINGSPSTVAYVGDSRISQTQLQTALTGVQQTLQEGQQVSTSAVINAMIHGSLAEQIAAKNNITITDAQRNKLLAGGDLSPLLAVPDAKTLAYDLADTQLVAQAVGSAAYLRDVQATVVNLNPRYGVLDPSTKTIVDGQSSSLSLPAPTS